MRLIVTSDLHYDHTNSRASADAIIGNINQAGCDVLLVVGDAAASAGTALEECLGRFTHRGPRLFVPGNHELWAYGPDSYGLFTDELPRRVRAIDWHWLQSEPFRCGSAGIVGSMGWYDYSFAQPELGIPRRFYESKVSPAAAGYFSDYRHLLTPSDDIPPQAAGFAARWNDGRFIKLHRSDDEFLDELLASLRDQLETLSRDGLETIVAAIHHLPFRELLPPARSAQWDFTKAYLGSERIGRLLLEYPLVSRVYCGHSHFPVQAQVGHIHAINTGSGYRMKFFHTLTLPD